MTETAAPTVQGDTMRDRFAISTHWNASRHKTGEGIVDEILELGIRRLELGYDLRSQHRLLGVAAPGAVHIIKRACV